MVDFNRFYFVLAETQSGDNLVSYNELVTALGASLTPSLTFFSGLIVPDSGNAGNQTASITQTINQSGFSLNTGDLYFPSNGYYQIQVATPARVAQGVRIAVADLSAQPIPFFRVSALLSTGGGVSAWVQGHYSVSTASSVAFAVYPSQTVFGVVNVTDYTTQYLDATFTQNLTTTALDNTNSSLLVTKLR